MSPTETTSTNPSNDPSTTPSADTCKRELSVEIPADVVAKESAAVLAKYQRLVRLPGFRQGKAPASVVRQRYAQEIQQEILDHLLPHALQADTQKHGLNPVSQPQVTDLHANLNAHEAEPIRFKASFEVLPEFELASYKGIAVAKPVVSVTDEQVEEVIQRMREQQATFVPVEGRTIADGDHAQVSLTGTPKDGEGDPITMDEILIDIGGTNTLPEFSAHLRGSEPGNEHTFDVVYPDEYSDERLKGKTFVYHVKVTAVKQKQLPELTDEFAKEVSTDFNTVADIRTRIRENMEAEQQSNQVREAKDKLVEELIARHEFPVPDALVEHQIDIRLDRGLRALSAQGMSTEQMRNMDFDRLRAAQREQAAKDVRASLIIEKIADAEKIDATEEEVDHEVQNLARQSKQTVEAVRQRLTDDGALDRIRDRIRSEKTVDFLYQQSA